MKIINLGLLLVVLAAGCTTTSTVKQAGFPTPDDAVSALVTAVRGQDKNALLGILGADAEDIISSGDEVADHNDYTKFLASYDEKHRLASENDGTVTLVTGDQDWPFPIPLVKQGNGWVFDIQYGKTEILRRRIGKNELAAIQVCLAIVDAEREYAMDDSDSNGLRNYAAKFISDPGQKNGLYWETKPDEKPSPIGPLFLHATEEGYGETNAPPNPQPYHGYCYRLLKSQGPNASGGAFSYLVNGQMIGGFAAVAFPVQYGNSGVMTFIVNHDGVVYQKDLGPDTEQIARAMQVFDPDSGWVKAE